MVAGISASQPRGATERLGKSVSFSHLGLFSTHWAPSPCPALFPGPCWLCAAFGCFLLPSQNGNQSLPEQVKPISHLLLHAGRCNLSLFHILPSHRFFQGVSWAGDFCHCCVTWSRGIASQRHSFIWANSSRADRTGDVIMLGFISCFPTISSGHHTGEGSWL